MQTNVVVPLGNQTPDKSHIGVKRNLFPPDSYTIRFPLRSQAGANYLRSSFFETFFQDLVHVTQSIRKEERKKEIKKVRRKILRKKESKRKTSKETHKIQGKGKNLESLLFPVRTRSIAIYRARTKKILICFVVFYGSAKQFERYISDRVRTKKILTTRTHAITLARLCNDHPAKRPHYRAKIGVCSGMNQPFLTYAQRRRLWVL